MSSRVKTPPTSAASSKGLRLMITKRNSANRPSWIANPATLALVLGGTLLVAGIASAAGAPKTQAEINKETFYQAVNLAILIGALVYFARKPIQEFFATRRTGIQTHLNEATELLEQAEQRNADLQRKLVDLSTEVSEIKAIARERAGEEAARIISDAEATAERIRRDAGAAVDQEFRRAQSELRAEAADLALSLAATKLEAEVGEADRDRLVDEFITRVGPTTTSTGGGAN